MRSWRRGCSPAAWTPTGETVVGVAHEALLRQWRPLREAIEASRASLRMRSELERLAADWDQGGRDDSYLLRGGRLVRLRRVGRRSRQRRRAAGAPVHRGSQDVGLPRARGGSTVQPAASGAHRVTDGSGPRHRLVAVWQFAQARNAKPSNVTLRSPVN